MKILISGYGRMGRMVEKIILSKQVEYAGWSESVTEVDKNLASECVCIDFTTPDAFRANVHRRNPDAPVFFVSAVAGDGLDELEAWLRSRINAVIGRE